MGPTTSGLTGNLFLDILVCGVGMLVFGLTPIVLGAISLWRINNSPGGKLRGRPLAWGAVVLGIIWIFAVPLLSFKSEFRKQSWNPVKRDPPTIVTPTQLDQVAKPPATLEQDSASSKRRRTPAPSTFDENPSSSPHAAPEKPAEKKNNAGAVEF
jgi:hypothetical protein